MLKRQVLPVTAFCLVVLLSIGLTAGDRPLARPNYDLASRWMAAKVGKLVFDTSVSPRWAEASDRFWYAFETAQGRKFMLVDPLKRTKAPLWDNAKMAAMLTNITRIPYDSQHLPITATTMKWVKNDTAIRFELEVPKDADIVGEKKDEKKSEDRSQKTEEKKTEETREEEVKKEEVKKTEERKTDEKKTDEKKAGRMPAPQFEPRERVGGTFRTSCRGHSGQCRGETSPR